MAPAVTARARSCWAAPEASRAGGRTPAAAGRGGARHWRRVAELLHQGGLGEGPQRYRRLADDHRRDLEAGDGGASRRACAAPSLPGATAASATSSASSPAFRSCWRPTSSPPRSGPVRSGTPRGSAATLEDAGLLARSPEPKASRGWRCSPTRTSTSTASPPCSRRSMREARQGVVPAARSCPAATNAPSSPGHEQFAALERLNLEVYSDFPARRPAAPRDAGMVRGRAHRGDPRRHARPHRPGGVRSSPAPSICRSSAPITPTCRGSATSSPATSCSRNCCGTTCAGSTAAARPSSRPPAAWSASSPRAGSAVRFEPLDQAVDAEAFSPERRDPRLHDELGGDGNVILWVGRVSAEKNLELLAAAFAAHPRAPQRREPRHRRRRAVPQDARGAVARGDVPRLPLRRGTGAHLRVVRRVRVPRDGRDLRSGRARGGDVGAADDRHRGHHPERGGGPGRDARSR